MDASFGLRREPGPDLEAVGEDEALVERIRVEIGRAGPMPFARFMALALYDPDGGYYRSAEPRPGRGGDFLTAPELHPIFGATLATALEEVWTALGRPNPFVVREHGAGTGALALGVLAGIQDPAVRAAIRYEPVEVDERRIAAFEAALAAAGHGDRIGRAVAGTPFEGVVLANEVLDALPVHRVRQRGGALRELAVDVGPDRRLVEVEVDPTTPALARRLADEDVTLVDGQTAEVCLEVEPWLEAATADLVRGLVLVIDYGAPAGELYDPRRRSAGTLRAYLRHHVHDDPLIHVGRQDLTAHVDVTAVERAAVAAGLTTIGLTTQAEALIGLGLEDRLRAIQTDPDTSAEAYTLVRAAVMRLLDPAAMGRFRVLAFGRGLTADERAWSLFRYRQPGRTGRR